MPRTNRVTPTGEIIATPERGAWLGNRGLLHDTEGRIRRPWQLKRWILCLLEFKGRSRQVMTPGRYTELFFLDEVTGLAAGHRPCAECRRDRFIAFRDAWLIGNPGIIGKQKPLATIIDDHLHAERVAENRSRRTFVARLEDLPNGVFVKGQGRGADVCLLWNGRLLAWSPAGYRRQPARPVREEVLVLTPKSIVGALLGGYVPQVHESASC